MFTREGPLALTVATFVLSLVNPLASWAKEISLLNVSYDPTRELYQEYNAAFAKHGKKKPVIP